MANTRGGVAAPPQSPVAGSNGPSPVAPPVEELTPAPAPASQQPQAATVEDEGDQAGEVETSSDGPRRPHRPQQGAPQHRYGQPQIDPIDNVPYSDPDPASPSNNWNNDHVNAGFNDGRSRNPMVDVEFPAPFPPRPELGTVRGAITWGPLPTDAEHDAAFRAWQLVERELRPTEKAKVRAEWAQKDEVHERIEDEEKRLVELRKAQYERREHKLRIEDAECGVWSVLQRLRNEGGEQGWVRGHYLDWQLRMTEHGGEADAVRIREENDQREEAGEREWANLVGDKVWQFEDFGAGLPDDVAGAGATKWAPDADPDPPSSPSSSSSSSAASESDSDPDQAPESDHDIDPETKAKWRKLTVKQLMEALKKPSKPYIKKERLLEMMEEQEKLKAQAKKTTATEPGKGGKKAGPKAASRAGKAASGDRRAAKEATRRQRASPVPATAPPAQPRSSPRGSLLQRARLEKWGPLPGRKEFDIPANPKGGMNAFEVLTWAVKLSPYNPAYWLYRGYNFYRLGQFELALGDAYRAWKLVTVVVNVLDREKQPGLYPRIWDAIENQIMRIGDEDPEVLALLRKNQGVPSFVQAMRKAAHHLISLALLRCSCISDAAAMDNNLLARLEMNAGDDWGTFHWRDSILNGTVDVPNIEVEKGELRIGEAKRRRYDRVRDERLWSHETRAGFIEGKAYPQHGPTVDRTERTFVNHVHSSYFPAVGTDDGGAQTWCGVDSYDGQGLQVVARHDIAPGQVIHVEEPSMRGNLQLKPRKGRWPEGEGECENCRRRVVVDDDTHNDMVARHREHTMDQAREQCACYFEKPSMLWCPARNESEENSSHQARVEAEAASPAKGRSKRKATTEADAPSKRAKVRGRGAKAPSHADEPRRQVQQEPPLTCLQIARANFHHRVCGKYWEWLHRGMQWENVSQFALRGTVYHYMHNTNLSLLLREAFDMALKQREQSSEQEAHTLAHETDALLPLEGGEDMPGRWFPFGWAANIVMPFDILETLGVNIFRDLDFDTWVIQTVLRKLAINVVPWDKWRRSDSGRDPGEHHIGPGAEMPLETFYLHPTFSLFNHACMDSSNAEWAWDGASDEKDPSVVPNRLTVKATREIAKGDVIRINYWPDDKQDTRDNFAARRFGRKCDCPKCEGQRAGQECSPVTSPLTR